MKRLTIYLTTALLLSALVGCTVGNEMTGDWVIEFDDWPDCEIELELEQYGDEIEGEAHLTCMTYPIVDGVQYEYELNHSDIEVEGEFEFEDDEFELELTIRDDIYGQFDIELEGEVDSDELEGEADFAGESIDFEGERD